MRINSILHGTEANGPELRTCIWVQGCTLGCPGCFNRATWDASGGGEIDPDRLAAEVFAHCLPGTKGVTVSGGEPMQQAVSLLAFFRGIKARRPDFSLGMFTGYSYLELVHGDYQLREPINLRDGDDRWIGPSGKSELWHTIYPMLDFVKMGRYDRAKPGESLAPLCTSTNQALHLPTIRYTMTDFPKNMVEYNIEADGLVVFTGFPC